MRTERPDLIVRLPELQRDYYPKSKAQLYRDMDEGLFPKPIKLGKRSVGWKMGDILGWQETALLGAGGPHRLRGGNCIAAW